MIINVINMLLFGVAVILMILVGEQLVLIGWNYTGLIIMIGSMLFGQYVLLFKSKWLDKGFFREEDD